MAKKKAVSAVGEAAPAKPQSKLSASDAALVAAMQDAKPIAGDIVSASVLQVIWAGNDCLLLWSSPRPAVRPDGTHAPAAISEVVAMLRLSSATMKDISVLIPEQVAKHEAKFGVIETAFTKGRQAKKKSLTQH